MFYAAAQEVDFDQQLWDASRPVFHEDGGFTMKLFFLP